MFIFVKEKRKCTFLYNIYRIGKRPYLSAVIIRLCIQLLFLCISCSIKCWVFYLYSSMIIVVVKFFRYQSYNHNSLNCKITRHFNIVGYMVLKMYLKKCSLRIDHISVEDLDDYFLKNVCKRYLIRWKKNIFLEGLKDSILKNFCNSCLIRWNK